jgi:hypothetical protein
VDIMARTRQLFIAVATAAVLGLVGCGAGSSGTGTGSGPTAGGGISGTGMAARGVVVAKGSLRVNDTVFNTDTATFVIDGDDTPSLDDIREGMVVEIIGTADDSGNAVAETVRTEEALRGPVGASPAADSFVVLGQTVILDIDTVVDDRSGPLAGDFSRLAEGDLVEVHGDVGDDAIVARFVEKKSAIAQYKVKGLVDAFSDPDLTINRLTVDTTGADVSDLPAGAPRAGQFVEVKFQPGSSTAVAKVELDGIDLGDEFLGELEVEGTVTGTVTAGAAFAPGDAFSVGTQVAHTDATTVFVGGVAADLAPGTRLEAGGQVDATGFLVQKVKFKEDIRLESDVASNDGTTLTLSHLPGITVTADAFTEFGGSGPSALGALTTAHHVRIRGRRSGSAGAAVVASRVDVEAADPDRMDLVLQGPVAAPADPLLEILGVTVDTTGFGFDDFQGEGDDASGIGRAAFFGALRAGDLVKAQARERDGSFAWREVQRED